MIVTVARLFPHRVNTGNRPGWLLNPFVRLLVYLVLVMLSLTAVSLLIGWLFLDPLTNQRLTGTLLMNLTYTIMLTGLYIFLIKKIEQRPVYELSGTMWFTELLAGLIIGAVLIAIVVLIFAIPGYYSIQSFNPLTGIMDGLVIFGYGAFFEELVFRLIIFKLLEEYFGSWISMAVSALIFGTAHMFNDHATLWSALAIAIEAGVLLSMAFIFTRRIWMAMGIHFAWNFMQASVFGLPASGMDFTGLITAEISGPAWLTGGEFGVEASPVTVLLGLIISWFLLRKALQDDQVVLPAWLQKKKTEIRY